MDQVQPKIAFASPHCLVDFTNGAATATLDALVCLQSLGFDCEAYCSSRLDSWEEVVVDELLAERGLPYTVSDMQIGAFRGRIVFTRYGNLPVTIFRSASTRGGWKDREEIAAFLTGCTIFLKKNRPDLVWTYGGDPVSRHLHNNVRALSMRLLFELHNFGYRDRAIFSPTDRVIVPTHFARQFYQKTLGMDFQVLPLVVDPQRVVVAHDAKCPHRAPLAEGEGGFVTFINPEPRKGMHVFSRIAEVLSLQRPDIPLLLVEGAAKRSSLPALGIDLSGMKNLTTWPNTPDVRKVYAASKLILMPSLMENAGFIAMEAMSNGIPVVASNRGGLPETIGDAAPMLDIPARYTPQTRDVPIKEEVAPWVETIIRLWDNPAEYDRWSQAARERSQAWHPDRLAPLYREFFSQIAARKAVVVTGARDGRWRPETRDPPGVPEPLLSANAILDSKAASPATYAIAPCPAICVIVPVHNGERLLHRALESVVQQTFTNWEVVAVDDGSTDGTQDALQRFAARDSRIRVIRLPENSGLSAARNAALRIARANYVTYLDHDDEYYPDYLSRVNGLRDKADVLVFEYDVVDVESGSVSTWDPRRAKGDIFARSIVTPLGVAHRRELWSRIGGFNEQLWREEDVDFIKRLARTGAAFVFVPAKSGRYYVRRDSLSRVPHLTRRQRDAAITNHQAGHPIFSDAVSAPRPHPVRKIVCAAPYSLIDLASGAALATAQGLQFLQALGFECRAFCGSECDRPEGVEAALHRHQTPYRHDTLTAGGDSLPVLVASLHGFVAYGPATPLEVTVFANERQRQSDFCHAWWTFLEAHRPDVVVACGEGPLAETLVRLAKKRDLPVVFWLHELTCHDPRVLALADYAIVPSQFGRQHYWEQIGLSAQVLPLVLDWSSVAVAQRRPRYLTFVNQRPADGLFVFAAIVEQLASRRPDIPMLAVSGHGDPAWRQRTGIDLSRFPNLTVRSNAPDRREVYADTKILLMPSLWNESFGLVATEAMFNGIPVLASNRGALPETIGDAGFIFDIPVRYTPETRDVPTVAEAEPWVGTIIRLWDDVADYERRCVAARERAQVWHPDRLAPIYREFFKNVTHQPGPPLVPRES